MTLLEIKTAIASYFNLTVNDLTINSQDLGLYALNQARKQAELLHDFEFSRKLVTATVNGVTGGSLTVAVDIVTSAAVDVKRVIEVGLFDSEDNFTPVEWTTVAEGLERQRLDNRYTSPRYPTDGWYEAGPQGVGRFQFAGDNIFRFPKDLNHSFDLGFEVYSFYSDWTNADLTGTYVTVTGSLTPDATGTYTRAGTLGGFPIYFTSVSDYVLANNGIAWILAEFSFTGGGTAHWDLLSTSQNPSGSYPAQGTAIGTATVLLTSAGEDVWTKYGHLYLMWAAIVILNHRFKEFVYRTEGNVAPPEKQRDDALEAFKEWDCSRYEANRRHGRV